MAMIKIVNLLMSPRLNADTPQVLEPTNNEQKVKGDLGFGLLTSMLITFFFIFLNRPMHQRPTYVQAMAQSASRVQFQEFHILLVD